MVFNGLVLGGNDAWQCDREHGALLLILVVDLDRTAKGFGNGSNKIKA